MARPVVVERGVLATTYLVLAALGALSGVIESYFVPQRIGGHLGVSLALALFGNLLIGALGGIGTRTWFGAAIPLIFWFIVIGVLSTAGPGGDVILPAKLPQDNGVTHITAGLLLVGTLGGGVALVLTSRYTGRAKAPRSPV